MTGETTTDNARASRDTEPARGVLLVWTDFPPEDEDEFAEWYNRVHIPDRVRGVDGFLNGIRYVCRDGGPRYLAFYETRTPEVLQSERYLGLQKNLDAQTARLLPRFRNTVRTAGVISARAGDAYGGHAALVEIRPPADAGPELHAAVSATVARLAESPGIARALFIRRDDSVLGSSAAVHVRKSDRKLDWAVLIEGTSCSAPERALAAHGWNAVRELGAEVAPARRFTTIFAMHAAA